MDIAPRRRTRLLARLVAVLAGVALVAPPPAAAAPAGSLAVTGLEAAPGVVRFLLTARDLPLNTALDPSTVTVSFDGTTMSAEAERVSRSVSALPPRALMVVLDVSGSVAGARLAAARAAARELAAALPQDVRLGLVAVSGEPRVLLPPTDDRAAFTAALGQLAARGDTALYDGVRLGLTTLDGAGFGAESDRRLLVLSDGEDTASTTTLAALTRELTAGGAPTDVVAFRAAESGLANLRAITESSGGHLLTAADNASLTKTFRTAAATFSVVLAVEARVPAELADRSGELTVTVDVAGAPLATSVPVTLGAGVADPATTLPRLPGAALPPWAIWAIVGLFFAGVLVLVLVLAWPRSGKQERIQQISQFGPARGVAPLPVDPAAPNALTRTALAASASFVRSRNLEGRIAVQLDRAGMRLRPHEWVLLHASATVTGAALGVTVLGWVGLLLGTLSGWLAPRLYRTIRIDRRTRRFAEQLPDVLQLVGGSLRSGFSLGQAIDAAVREAPHPIAAELGRALAEHRLGADMSEALERVAERTKSDDLMWVVMAVRIQREVGGNLAEVLQTAVETMRERDRLRRHVRALSAEGRLSAYVLIGLPILLGLFMFTFRGDYMAPLLADPLGLAMLLVGLVLLVAGIVWISRVVKVEA